MGDLAVGVPGIMAYWFRGHFWLTTTIEGGTLDSHHHLDTPIARERVAAALEEAGDFLPASD